MTSLLYLVLVTALVASVHGDVQWRIQVETGTASDAWTNGYVYIKLVGSKGTTGAYELDDSADNFQGGLVEHFDVSTEDIGTLKEIQVYHDEQTGKSPRWHLTRMTVERVDNKENPYVFDCDCWLSTDVGYKTLQPSNVQWRLTVVTSDVFNAGIDQNVHIRFTGTEGRSRDIEVNDEADNFERGMEEHFYISTKDIGTPTKVTVWLVDHEGGGSWHLAKIELQRVGHADNKKYPADCHRWLSKVYGDNTLERTLQFSQDKCPEGWSLYQEENKCIKSYSDEKTFRDAMAKCREEGALLVQIYDDAKNEFVAHLMKQHGAYEVQWSYIGVYQQGRGAFNYYNGSQITYHPWGPGSPLGTGCVSLHYQLSWIVIGCDYPDHYVCEKDAEGEEEEVAPVNNCPDGWTPYEGDNTCVKAFDDRMGFHEARATCKEQEGDLVSIYDDAKNTFIGDMRDDNLGGYKWVWIGVYRQADGEYADADGTSLSYLPWSPDYPKSYSNDCVQTYLDTWITYRCDYQDPFVCERDPVKGGSK